MRKTHHALNDILDFPDSQFQDQTDGLFILAVLLNHLFEQFLRFLSVPARLDARITCVLHGSKTNNLIPIVHKLINKPLERKIGVFVLIRPAEKGPTPSSALITFVLVVQRQREIRRIGVIERVKRNTSFVCTTMVSPILPNRTSRQDKELTSAAEAKAHD